MLTVNWYPSSVLDFWATVLSGLKKKKISRPEDVEAEIETKGKKQSLENRLDSLEALTTTQKLDCLSDRIT